MPNCWANAYLASTPISCVEFVKSHQAMFFADGRAVSTQLGVHRLDRAGGGEEAGQWVEDQVEAEFCQNFLIQHRRLTAFDHVGHIGAGRAAADFRQLFDVVRSLDEAGVGAGCACLPGRAPPLHPFRPRPARRCGPQ